MAITPDFNHEKFTMLLNLPEVEIPEKIQETAVQQGYEQKSEFHVTAIGYPNAKKIRQVIKKKNKVNKISNFKEQQKYLDKYYREQEALLEDVIKTLEYLASSINWQDCELTKKYHKIAKEYQGKDGALEIRESIIQMVVMPGLEELYEKINALFGTTFAVPPAHITLYTKGTDPETSCHGVGLYSENEFKKCDQGMIQQ